MNKDIYLCKEGSCGLVDLSFLYPNREIKNLGICCSECKNKKECPSVCDVVRFRHLKEEECDFRINYKDKLEDILKNKRETLVYTLNEIDGIANEISKIEGKVNIPSPLSCKMCGSVDVDYNTTVVLLSCPPKYRGTCKCGYTQYIETNVYKELVKK